MSAFSPLRLHMVGKQYSLYIAPGLLFAIVPRTSLMFEATDTASSLIKSEQL